MGIYGCIAVRDAFSRTFYPLLYRYRLVGVPRSSPPSSKSLSASFRPIYLVQLCRYIHNYLYLVSISYISTIIILYIVVSAYSASSPVAPTLYLVGTTILYTTSRILLYLVYTPISTHYILGTTISCTLTHFYTRYRISVNYTYLALLCLRCTAYQSPCDCYTTRESHEICFLNVFLTDPYIYTGRPILVSSRQFWYISYLYSYFYHYISYLF